MIWPDRERDLGYTCTENHIPGVFSCRRCGRTGDSIRYMMDMEGMSFREACAELGISDMPVRPRRRPAPLEPQVRAAWQPSVKEGPSERWQNYAAKLLAEAEAEIWNHPEALNWLARTASPDGSGRVPSSGFRRSRGTARTRHGCSSLAAS